MKTPAKELQTASEPRTRAEPARAKCEDVDEPIVAPGTRVIRDSLHEMARTPRSGVEMCHAQGKTAVYLSEDETEIVIERPNGEVTRKPYVPVPVRER